jgi:penicillin-binding protein 1C
MLDRKPKNFFIGLTLFAVFCGVLLCVQVYRAVKDTVVLLKPSATALIEDRYGIFLSEGSGNDLTGIGYWEIAEPIPDRIEAAFLAIEDKRFYQHSGADWRAVLRALWNNITNETRQGASTIAMQVARMQRDIPLTFLYLPQEGNERTYWNKFCESITALLLIRKFGHQAVLKHYLEIVPQGNRIHGVAYAARRYFRKPLQDLSWAEAAVLAALPKAPGKMNLFRADGRKKAFARTELILKQLHKNGRLDDENFLAARRQLSGLHIPTKETRPAHSYHVILRLEELLRKKTTDYLYTQPIRASLDLSIQEQVKVFADAAITHYRASGAGNIAVMVIEKDTGKVVAYLGSEEYHDLEYAGAINYARVPRSSGSTLKPFIYALGLEMDYFSPASLLSDMPILVSLPRGSHRIGNYDEKNLGFLMYRKALANSRNVPAIHVLIRVGVENAYELFRQLGLVNDRRPAGHYGVGLAIGTLYVTLEDLVTAYGVLANDGKAFRLRWFESPGGFFASNEEELPYYGEQVMSEDVTRQISLFLSDPLARLPTFSRMGPLEYPFPVAVKTGTSQGFRDAWAVAYSSKYIVGVWIGHPDNTRMKNVSGLAAAQVVKQIMVFLHPAERRGIAENMFPIPEGYKLVRICSLNGRPATDNCPEIIPEYFRPGAKPIAYQAVSYQKSSTGTTPSYGQSPLPSANPLSYAFSPFSFEQLLNANITINEPLPGGTFILDPDTPRTMQTVSLRATVTPAVHKIIWHVDGKPFTSAAYPYTVRWPLTPGTHTIQARFAYANIASEVITIRVYQ